MPFQIGYPFVDPAGKISDKPNDQELGITDNGLLFTGELMFLLKKLGKYGISEDSLALCTLFSSRIMPGLYTRHPIEFLNKYGVAHNTISHDEYLGVLLLAFALDRPQQEAREIVEYGKKFNWQYTDLYPEADFFRALKRNPIETIKKFIAYKKDYKANPNDTNSVDLRHDSDITALTFIRQPRDRALYKLIAGESPSILESLWLSFAHVYTTRRDLEDGSRGGTMLLAWFRMELLKSACKKLPLVLRLSHWAFGKLLSRRYGKNYAKVIANRYFDRVGSQGERHPIISLIGEYTNG